VIELPWPHKDLSPNARIHWGDRRRLVASYRGACCLLANLSGVRPIEAERVAMTIRFCPPDMRRRDMDNLIAATKALRDGLMDALGVDDSRFVVTYEMGEPIKGGAVMVQI